MTDKSTKPNNVTSEENPSGIKGLLTLSEDFMGAIGIAAKRVDSIYKIGKSNLMHFRDKPFYGVHTELGKIQAAFDVKVITMHGKNIREVAQQLRTRVSEKVNRRSRGGSSQAEDSTDPVSKIID